MSWPKQDVDYVSARLALNGASTAAVVVLFDRWADGGVRNVRRYIDGIQDLLAEIREAEHYADLARERARRCAAAVPEHRRTHAASDTTKRWPTSSA